MICLGIASPAIVTIVLFVEIVIPQSLLFAALTILLTIVVAFIATMIIRFEDVEDENDEEVAAICIDMDEGGSVTLTENDIDRYDVLD